ncbi:hypothetical protein [Rhodopirellula bahusiensis]|uniref:hypothetical protein n=1 Tax=Rhodopirellula bahusiensis TaxID=2014065 RepID=UPI0032658353
MTIARDRLKLSEFTPLAHELETVRLLSELKCRFAIDNTGSVVKLYVWQKLIDQHIRLVLALPNLQFFSSVNLLPSSAGITDEGLAELLTNPNLKEIFCQGHERLNGSFLGGLKQGASVTRIGVPYCPIEDAGLALAENFTLTHLSVRGSQISDASIEALCSMNLLAQIHVKETHVTSLGLERLKQSLPNCWIDAVHRPNDG